MRIALLVEYAGGKFCGSQYQSSVRTVQHELEKALSIFARKEVATVFSGRTDSGVHARGQVVHIDWSNEITGSTADLWRLIWAVNGILPEDVAVRKAQIVPEQFHARFKAVARQYVYRILNSRQRSPLLRDDHYFIPKELDCDAIAEALQTLVGVHDFTGFRSTSPDNGSPVCHVSSAELLKLDEGRLEVWIKSDHFVYNMMRIIVGSLVEIGLGKETPRLLSQVLSEKDRRLSGPTAPALGLCLDSVQYPEEYCLFQTGKTAQGAQDEAPAAN